MHLNCNQCNLAHDSYICLPKILRWRIHGCRHIFGLWKKLYLGLGGRFTFIGQKYLWLGVCHNSLIGLYVLRSSWDPQLQTLNLTLFLTLHNLICFPKILDDEYIDVVIFWVVKKAVSLVRRPFHIHWLGLCFKIFMRSPNAKSNV